MEAFTSNAQMDGNSMTKPTRNIAVMALSGGMDSTSLLLHLLSKGYDVTAISFNYGQ